MRYYYIPTRITIARKRQTIPIIGDDVEKTQPSNIVGIENGAETWKTFWQFIKLLNKNLLYNLEITHLRTYPREKKTCPHKDMYVNVHRSIICNRQKPEIIQIDCKQSQNWWMDMKNLLCLYMGFLCYLKVMSFYKPSVSRNGLEQRSNNLRTHLVNRMHKISQDKVQIIQS